MVTKFLRDGYGWLTMENNIFYLGSIGRSWPITMINGVCILCDPPPENRPRDPLKGPPSSPFWKQRWFCREWVVASSYITIRPATCHGSTNSSWHIPARESTQIRVARITTGCHLFNCEDPLGPPLWIISPISTYPYGCLPIKLKSSPHSIAPPEWCIATVHGDSTVYFVWLSSQLSVQDNEQEFWDMCLRASPRLASWQLTSEASRWDNETLNLEQWLMNKLLTLKQVGSVK